MLATIKGHFKMWSFVTQHNAIDVSSLSFSVIFYRYSTASFLSFCNLFYRDITASLSSKGLLFHDLDFKCTVHSHTSLIIEHTYRTLESQTTTAFMYCRLFLRPRPQHQDSISNTIHILYINNHKALLVLCCHPG